LVSVGNANEFITLPPMDRVIGDVQILERLAGGQPDSLSKEGGITAELQVILGATNELGFEALSTEEI
jgi:sarcosine reductase